MKKLLSVMVILLLGAFLFWHFNLFQCLTLTAIQRESAYLKEFVERSYLLSMLLFIGAYASAVACGLPITAPFTILGGFLFGTGAGFLYALMGATIGSILYFLLIRYVLTNFVRNNYAVQLNRFNTRFKKYGYSYLLTLHWLMVVPYFVVNTLAALAGVPLFMLIWTTILGSSPLLFIYAFAGKQLHEINSFRDILRPDIIIMFVLFALLALLPMIIQKFRRTVEL
ncbi:MAG: VTT domain-containing protein [bacterium]|nr:VTT domain-containing protein [bacterium]